jgi:hypothetical protein
MHVSVHKVFVADRIRPKFSRSTKIMKLISLLVFSLYLAFLHSYRLVFEENFSSGLKNWVVEDAMDVSGSCSKYRNNVSNVFLDESGLHLKVTRGEYKLCPQGKCLRLCFADSHRQVAVCSLGVFTRLRSGSTASSSSRPKSLRRTRSGRRYGSPTPTVSQRDCCY